MRFRLLFFLLLILIIQDTGLSQVGGRNVYKFLDLSASSRLTSLGDHVISVADADISLAWDNPASLSDTVHGQLSFNHSFYFQDIDHGYFSYASKLPWYNLVAHGGLKYIGYGDFIQADIYGNKTGNFKANETAFVFGLSRTLADKMIIGINAKLIQSRLESYNSFGIAFDLGMQYQLPDKTARIGFVLKNMGSQFSSYSGTKEALPFDIRLGYSKRLKHLPFRFDITAHHLYRWNILYDDPNEENNDIFLGEEQEESRLGILTDNLFRHLIFSGEFLIGKKENLRLRFSYNHLKRRELSVDNYISMAGFSFGAGIQIRRFTLDYAYSVYHLAGGISHVGVGVNINQLFKKT